MPGFLRVRPSGAAEALRLRNATAVNAAPFVPHRTLCLRAHLDRDAARTTTRHAGALGAGAAWGAGRRPRLEPLRPA